MRRLGFVVICCGALVGCGDEAGEEAGSATEVTDGGTADEVTSSPTTGEATTGGASGEYTAFYVPPGDGQYTRLVVRRVDVEADLCTSVMFISLPEINEGLTITAPAMWSAEGAIVQQGAADCLTVYQKANEPADAESGIGTVTWAQDVTCPATVDIDVTVQFMSELTWAPAQVQLQAEGIAVQGC